MKTERKTYGPRDDLLKVRTFIAHEQGRDGQKIDMTAMSKTTGLPYKGISRMFRVGDMRLSRAEAIGRAYGAHLRLLFPARPEMDWIEERIRTSPITESDRKSGNLMGLKKYMEAMKITVNRASIRMGRSRKMLRQAFDTGDIKISNLGDICEELGISCIWQWAHKAEDDRRPGIEILSEDNYEIWESEKEKENQLKQLK